jgi:hypothetical protein
MLVKVTETYPKSFDDASATYDVVLVRSRIAIFFTSFFSCTMADDMLKNVRNRYGCPWQGRVQVLRELCLESASLEVMETISHNLRRQGFDNFIVFSARVFNVHCNDCP